MPKLLEAAINMKTQAVAMLASVTCINVVGEKLRLGRRWVGVGGVAWSPSC